MSDPAKEQVYYSYAVASKEVVEVTMPLGANFAWDAFWRAAYDRAASGIGRQARELLERGNVTFEEMRNLVEVQRNALVVEFRKPLTPFGRLYSEILKPSSDLPTAEKLLAKKQTIEAVLRSVGKTRQAVNRIAMVSRVAGPALITIDVTLTIVVIAMTPEAQRARVAAREVGGLAGGTAGTLGGMWAGCAGFALLASPTLTIPIVGEVTTGGACLIGGALGGLGLGLAGRWGGEWLGATSWQLSDFNWH